MKKIIFFSLIISLIIGSCAKEKKSPIEGAWQLVFAQIIAGDTVSKSLPGDALGSQIKIITKEHFIFVGQFTFLPDSTSSDNYGVGTYKFEGDRFEENAKYSSSKSSVGKKIRLLTEIRNDTLIQKYPADDDWKINKSKYNLIKFIRLE